MTEYDSSLDSASHPSVLIRLAAAKGEPAGLSVFLREGVSSELIVPQGAAEISSPQAHAKGRDREDED